MERRSDKCFCNFYNNSPLTTFESCGEIFCPFGFTLLQHKLAQHKKKDEKSLLGLKIFFKKMFNLE